MPDSDSNASGNRLGGTYPHVKYRSNDIESWKCEMYDIFLSLDLDYVVDNAEWKHVDFCAILGKDPNNFPEASSRRKYKQMQARANTMLRLATSTNQHRLIRGFGSETFKIWQFLSRAPTSTNKRSRISELVATLYTTRVSTAGSYKMFASNLDETILKLDDLGAKPDDEDIKDHFLRGLDTSEFVERIETAISKPDYAATRAYVDNSVDLRARYQRIRSSTASKSSINNLGTTGSDICRGFAKTGKCTRKSCPWKHPNRRQPRKDQRRNNNSRSSNPPQGAKTGDCFAFVRTGKCSRNNCSYNHPSSTGAAKSNGQVNHISSSCIYCGSSHSGECQVAMMLMKDFIKSKGKSSSSSSSSRKEKASADQVTARDIPESAFDRMFRQEIQKATIDHITTTEQYLSLDYLSKPSTFELKFEPPIELLPAENSLLNRLQTSRPKMILDSGCLGKHALPPGAASIYNRQACNVEVTAAFGKPQMISSKGDATILDNNNKEFHLSDVIEVPGLSKGLISSRLLANQGNVQVLWPDKLEIYDVKNFHIARQCRPKHTGTVDSDGAWLLNSESIDMATHPSDTSLAQTDHQVNANAHQMKKIKPPAEGTAAFKKGNDLLISWHNRMGHLNFQDLRHLRPWGLEWVPTTNPICSCCRVNKLKAASKKSKSKVQRTAPPTDDGKVRIHYDLSGRLPDSIHGHKQFLLIKNSRDGTIEATPLAVKSDAAEVVLQYARRLQTTYPGNEVAYVFPNQGTHYDFISDNAPELISRKMKIALGTMGISLSPIPPHTPWKNGMVEREMGTIKNMVKCMLASSRMPKSFWSLAVVYAATTRNFCPSSSRGHVAPTQLKTGVRLTPDDFQKFKPFGTGVVVLIQPYQKRKGLRPSGVPGIFVGICPSRGCGMVLNPLSNKIIYSDDLSFDFTTHSGYNILQGVRSVRIKGVHQLNIS